MVREGIDKVENGVKGVKEVSSVLRSIRQSSLQSSTKAQLIKRTTKEQANTILQLVGAINNINERIEHISRAT
jgi:methyl-accepting chemotaxis protein